ncbi:MAG: hypothetical protein J6S54_01880 [Lentisphaeria bacterium]|nr:hypothetical protein [Lentisphaeria bacterium]
MKKIFAFIPVLLICAGCAVCTPAPQKAAPQKYTGKYTGKKLKTAFYIDKGARGGGVTNLGRLLAFSPQIEMTMVNGEDLRKGKLKNFDLFVMPGGSSQLEMESMGPEGVKVLQEFIRKGGAYVGICAGFHIMLNRPERAQLVPYTYIREAVGARGDVQIDLSKEGAKILGVKPGKRMVRYSRGPIAKEAKWAKGSCKTYALYTSSISPLGKAGKSFFNTPALIAGTYGKGKVIASSFHPEYKVETYELFVGMVYYATGIKLTPQIPVPAYRPLRTIYYAGAAAKGHIQSIPEYVALERCTALQLSSSFGKGQLDYTDLLILPNSPANWRAGFLKGNWIAVFKAFMERGGKIIAAGDTWNFLPAHKNLTRLPADGCLVKAAAEVAAK